MFASPAIAFVQLGEHSSGMAHFLPVVGIVLFACTWGVVQLFVAPIILAGITRRAHERSAPALPL